MANEYDFWVFDLDGTLVDAEWSYTRSTFDEVGDRLGREFTDRQAELLWHGLNGSRDALLAEWGVDRDRFWEVFHDVEDGQVRAEHTYLHDDATVVGDLEEPVALVTHCQRFLTEPVLEHLDIRDWFDAIVCCTDEIGWKPDPTPVEMAMDDLDVGANGHVGLLAGDAPSDVGAAWNAGLDAAHVERFDPHERGHCVLADHRLRRLDELDALEA